MRYPIAIVFGLLVGGYLYLAHAPQDKVVVSAAGAFSLVITAYLINDIHPLEKERLGDLQYEKPALMGALAFFLVYAFFGLLFTLNDYPFSPRAAAGSPGEAAQGDWIYGTWAADRACENTITISKGERPGEIVIETRDPDTGRTTPHSRTIVGDPTPNLVATREGNFRLRADGTLSMSDRPMEDERLRRCV